MGGAILDTCELEEQFLRMLGGAHGQSDEMQKCIIAEYGALHTDAYRNLDSLNLSSLSNHLRVELRSEDGFQ